MNDLPVNPAPADGEPAQPPTPEPPQPPAAVIVDRGEKKEEDAGLTLENKKLQTKISELEDERRRLLEATKPPAPTPAPEKKSFLEGGTFFG